MEHIIQLGIELLGAFIGAFLGYLLGMNLFRKQQEEEKKSKKKRLITALILEITNHKDVIKNQPKINFDTEFLEIMIFNTSSYYSSINSGLFSLLSPKLQNLVSEHYTICKYINDIKYEILSLTSKKERKKALMYNENIRLAQDKIRKHIDIILRKLKYELSNL